MRFLIAFTSLSLAFGACKDREDSTLLDAPVVQTFAKPMMVGPYQVNVPEGMHIVHYASKNTVTSQVDSFRLAGAQTRAINPPIDCAPNDTAEMWRTPEGAPMTYCHRSTSTASALSQGIATTAIELETDDHISAQNPADYEYLQVTLHDKLSPNQPTRFAKICKSIGGARPEMFANIPLLTTDDLSVLPQPFDFHWCMQSIKLSGVDQKVMVGTFYTTKGFSFQRPYTNILEVTYIAGLGPQTAAGMMFAQQAQKRILNLLRKSRQH